MRDLGLFKHPHMLVDTWLWLVRSGGDEVSVIWAQFWSPVLLIIFLTMKKVLSPCFCILLNCSP